MKLSAMNQPSAITNAYQYDTTGDELPTDNVTQSTGLHAVALTLPREPSDYQRFWTQTWLAAEQIDLSLQIDKEADRTGLAHEKGLSVYQVCYRSWEDRRIHAILILPQRHHVKEAWVVGHGYSGRLKPDENWYAEDRAIIFPCCRGLGLSSGEDIPGPDKGHSIHGIWSRESYVHRGCVVDTWLAASALLQMVPHASSHLFYLGSSFGGGIGAMALAWDHRYRSAALRLPSYGHHPIRLQTACTGSGEIVREAYLTDPKVAQVLSYYDAAVAARRCHLPVLAAVAKNDPAVPPAGQMSVYLGLPGPKQLVQLTAGHQPYPQESHENHLWEQSVEAWFGASISKE